MSKAPAKHINFMAPRKVLGILSITLVVISIALLATRGLNLGLDFTGGITAPPGKSASAWRPPKAWKPTRWAAWCSKR